MALWLSIPKKNPWMIHIFWMFWPIKYVWGQPFKKEGQLGSRWRMIDATQSFYFLFHKPWMSGSRKFNRSGFHGFMSLVGFQKLPTWPRALDFWFTVGGGFMFYPGNNVRILKKQSNRLKAPRRSVWLLVVAASNCRPLWDLCIWLAIFDVFCYRIREHF